MTDEDDVTRRLSELASTWHGEIPVTSTMDVVPAAFEEHTLTVRATLAPNVNVHGTAFAGSLYAVAALSGWGLVHLELANADLPGSIVIAEGRIVYRRPVQEDIVARCSTDDAEVTRVMAALRTDGRVRWPLTASIGAAGREAVRFEGVYAIRIRDR
ncbi:MAG: YiiD C-terminal domain-containing protein [Pseudomonadales bacterium]|jgi:thioesterase domain-containing protein|nr:YiiD C-terminal domain-containing protein [Pseudomonadales bacterium]